MNTIQVSPSAVYDPTLYKARLVIIRKSDKKVAGIYDMTESLAKWGKKNTCAEKTSFMASDPDTPRNLERSESAVSVASVTKTALGVINKTVLSGSVVRFCGRFIPWTCGVIGTFLAAKQIVEIYLHWDNSENAQANGYALQAFVYGVGAAVIISIDKVAKKALKHHDPLLRFAKGMISNAPDDFLDLLSSAGKTILKIDDSKEKVYLQKMASAKKKPNGEIFVNVSDIHSMDDASIRESILNKLAMSPSNKGIGISPTANIMRPNPFRRASLEPIKEEHFIKTQPSNRGRSDTVDDEHDFAAIEEVDAGGFQESRRRSLSAPLRPKSGYAQALNINPGDDHE